MTAALALFKWERATLPASEITQGLLAHKHLTLLTLLFYIPLGVLFAWMFQSPYASLLALPFARLMALDLTTYTLPDVYTLPLITLGAAHAVTQGMPINLAIALGLMGLATLLAQRFPKAGLGGGDIKLLTALFLWLSPANACFTVALGCLLWLPVACVFPRKPQPFGIPLILGWVLFSAFFMASDLRYPTFLPI